MNLWLLALAGAGAALALKKKPVTTITPTSSPPPVTPTTQTAISPTKINNTTLIPVGELPTNTPVDYSPTLKPGYTPVYTAQWVRSGVWTPIKTLVGYINAPPNPKIGDQVTFSVNRHATWVGFWEVNTP